MNNLDRFTEELHEWSVTGKEPAGASRDLRFFLDLQEKRLRRTGVTREEEYTSVKDAVSGSVPRRGNGYTSRLQYREAVQTVTYLRGGKCVKRFRRPVNLYLNVVDREDRQDREYVCPACGNRMTALQARDGCPYCGASFETDEVYPCVTSYYTVPGIVERAGLMDKLKKQMLIVGVGCGVLLAVICLFVWTDMPWLLRIPAALFMGGLYGGVSAFLWYLFRSLLLLFRVFREAGRSLPLLKTVRSRKKMCAFMQPYDPDFSYEAFEGRVLSLLRTIVFTDDRETLCVWAGGRDLSGFDCVADMQYRGGVYLSRFESRDGLLVAEGTAYLTNAYLRRTVRERDERIRFTLAKDARANADPGFSVHRVVCANCAASFDAMHRANCPRCGTPYDLKKKDWIVLDMHKV